MDDLNFIAMLLGIYMGTVIAMPLAGILAEYVSWDSIFYVFGKLPNMFMLY